MLRQASNKYSQNGEDGILQEIFRRLNVQTGSFIEFGAWDGIHFSNCRKLFEEGWAGIFIESDTEKFNDLVKNYESHQNIDCVKAFVGYSFDDSLDHLIEKHSTKRSFDLVSIDVDGLDQNILEAYSKYLPKVIVIEVQSFHDPLYSTIIPTEIAKENIGQSLTVMNRLAAHKGQFPVAQNGNLFLVKNEYKSLFLDVDQSISAMYDAYLQHFSKDTELMSYMCTLVKKGSINNFRFHNPAYLAHCKKLNL